MLRIAPFRAIRPQPNQAARVASVPYDVVDTEQAREQAQGNAVSFLHVIRPEIDLPPGIDLYDEQVYEQGRKSLDGLIADGVLVQDEQPRLYLYRQVMNHRPQIGLVACCHIGDYAAGLIKKHEKTRPDKEDDRTRHVLSLNANTGPVFLTFRDRENVNKFIADDTNARPVYHFDAPDGVTHTVWAAKDPQRYVDAFRDVPCAYVADGHHRSASAARAGAERRAANPAHTGHEEYNWFLAVLFPADVLTILAYNRVLKDLNGQTPAEVLDRLGDLGALEPTRESVPDRPGVFCVHVDGAWHRLEIDPVSIDTADPVGSLDVALLQERILDPIFGVHDPRTDPRIEFVGGIRGTSVLADRVAALGTGAAVSVYPTSIDQLMNVADAERLMPPKSTWFEPKLRSGLFVHGLE